MPTRIVAALLLLGAALLWPASAAVADAAAGNAAFEKGDYVRAMAEWTSAAERGDADAEFGLGMLYERGDGNLQQSYKDADRWYQKAADHDHIGAEYRLALVWSAGDDQFPANLVEAYKWILLASERGLATDVKAQIANVLDPRQLADAQKKAAAWKEAHVKKPEPPPSNTSPVAVPGPSSTVSIPPPRSTTTTTTSGKGGGCPGWPFPTLPCTEQFPALPGSTAGKTPTIPPPRAPAQK